MTAASACPASSRSQLATARAASRASSPTSPPGNIGGRLCHAAPDAAVTADANGNHTVTVVNASFDAAKPVELSAFGTCTQATLYSADTVLPPSRFAEQDILAEAQTGRLQLPPHSFVLLHFAKA